MDKILVTGGAGYIGSHTLIALIEAGFTPIVIDNFHNSSSEAIRRVEVITGTSITLYEGDVRDGQLLAHIFQSHTIAAVIHFAGLKAVGESTAKPTFYYQNNVAGSLALLEAMANAGVKNVVFSSSATVYGIPERLPIVETDPVGGTTNPYGTSKFMVERILADIYAADKAWNIAVLRYFNPVGAHSSGQIGEDPSDIPNNLMPFITQVAVGKRQKLSVFGGDYPTPDGTGVRDYIHVADLAEGHVSALQSFANNLGYFTVNLGTGVGYSVLDMVKAFEAATGRSIPFEIVARRPGDIASCYADTTKAKVLLGWSATKTLDDMMRDSWAWQSSNPDGYR